MDAKIQIPRAEYAIQRTVAGLSVTLFDQDPLMTHEESFRQSIWASAVKRDGAVIEAAIMDAIDQTPELTLMIPGRTEKRNVDVQFEAQKQLVALEIKRGSLHDSTKIRQFRADLLAMPALLQRALPQYPLDHVRFHIVFIGGKPPIAEGLTILDLKKLYGLNAIFHIEKARHQFSRQVRDVIEARTK